MYENIIQKDMNIQQVLSSSALVTIQKKTIFEELMLKTDARYFEPNTLRLVRIDVHQWVFI